MFKYKFPRPAVTADVVMFTMRADDLAVLLIRRGAEPFEGSWALPGGFVDENEALERAAARELEEETGVSGVPMEQLGAFGNPGRDPRCHTVTVAYFTFVLAESVRARAGDDAADVAWHPLRSLPLRSAFSPRAKPRTRSKPPPITLAFDHDVIIDAALGRLRERLDDPLRPSRFQLVPPRFTLAELQRVYEVILGRSLDKRNFRARLLARGLVEPAGATARKTGRHRPAQLYRWNR